MAQTDWLDVSDTTPIISYTVGTTPQTVFTVPFVFFSNSDLTVTVNGQLKTLNTDYIPVGAGTPTGGTITFVAGLSNCEVTIRRNTSVSLDTHIPLFGPLDVGGLNLQFSRLIAIAQELRDRAVLLSTMSRFSGLVLGDPEPGRILKWSEDGQRIESTALVNPGNYLIATPSEAIAGESNDVLMTPIRTFQAIDSMTYTQGQADLQFATKADTYTKSEVYAKSETYSKDEVNSHLVTDAFRVRPSAWKSLAFPADPSIFPVAVTGVGLGSTKLSVDINTAFSRVPKTLNTTIVWADPAGSGTTGSEASPVTLDYALQTSTASLVYLKPGVYAPVLLDRASHAGIAAVAKRVSVPSGKVTFRMAGPALSDQTWTAHDAINYPGIYKTTLSALDTGAKPHRVLNTNLFDAWGFPAGVPYFTSLAGVLAADTGWYFDVSTKVIYMKFSGFNVETYKARFQALYVAADGTSGFRFRDGTYIMFDAIGDNMLFDGVGITTEEKVGGTGLASFVYLKDGVYRYSYTYGVYNDSGAFVYASGCRVHRCTYDGFNYNPNTISGNKAFGVEHNVLVTCPGDSESFAAGGTDTTGLAMTFTNRQGSSAHPGANVLRAGSKYSQAWGQLVADVGGAAGNSMSYNVGCITEKAAVPGTDYGFDMYGDASGTMTAWIDACAHVGNGGVAAASNDSHCTVYYSNLRTSPMSVSGGIVTPFNTEAPG